MTKEKRGGDRDRRRRGRYGEPQAQAQTHNTKSGYYGVIPNGKGWRARVYKETKKSWDTVGTYSTAQEGAIAVALAERQVAAGNGNVYSPEKQKATAQKGAFPTR